MTSTTPPYSFGAPFGGAFGAPSAAAQAEDRARDQLSQYLFRWLGALNAAFPEGEGYWSAMVETPEVLDAVAQYCLTHYRSAAACLELDPTSGLLAITPANDEFLPSMSAAEVFNRAAVSPEARQSLAASYTQCMHTIVAFSGCFANEDEDDDDEDEDNSDQMDECGGGGGGKRRKPCVGAALEGAVHSTARYADLFEYLLAKASTGGTVNTGVAAVDGFLSTATGQWASVLVVRHFCEKHTDVLCELCQFVEEKLRVNVADRANWTDQLLPVLMRKVMTLVQSTPRRAAAWAWAQSWLRWFAPGSPAALVSRAEFDLAGGRGLVYPDSLAADVRQVLAAASTGEALAKMELQQTEMLRIYDAAVAAWERDDQPAFDAIIQGFVQSPAAQNALRQFAANLGMPVDALFGAFGGGADAAHGAPGAPGAPEAPGAAGAGRKGSAASRAAIIARMRARQTVANSGPPDTRSIDELMAFIGDVDTGGNNNNNKKEARRRRK